jgi:hypothetical protein
LCTLQVSKQMYGGVGGQCKFLGKESEWDERKYMQAKVPRNQRQMFLEQMQFARSCSRASVQQQRATCLPVQKYLLYWYKRTIRTACSSRGAAREHLCNSRELLAYRYKSTCFTGTNDNKNSVQFARSCLRASVQQQRATCLLVQKYLLYWYKSTNADATRVHVCINRALRNIFF